MCSGSGWQAFLDQGTIFPTLFLPDRQAIPAKLGPLVTGSSQASSAVTSTPSDGYGTVLSEELSDLESLVWH